MPGMTSWAVMMAVALTMLLVLKTGVLILYLRTQTPRPSWLRVSLWFLAWPGLNAQEFFQRPNAVAIAGPRRQWFQPLAFITSGAGLLILVRTAVCLPVPARGLLAMAGLLCLFHFGLFHLLALMWQHAGVPVTPLMNAPWHATSLGEFWGRRWNLAFRDFAHGWVFRPSLRHWNTSTATWNCFVFSGLVHELAISVPARSGYGGPLLFFLWQGLCVVLERRTCVRAWLQSSLWRARLAVMLSLSPALVCLFHRPFLTRVILPLAGVPDAH